MRLLRKIDTFCNSIASRILHPDLQCDGYLLTKRNTRIIINTDGKMKFGRNVSFQDGVHLTAVKGGCLSIGNNVSFNRYCIVVCRKNIQIDDGCIFGPNVVIYDHDHKYNSCGVAFDEYTLGTIHIKNGCWIGANVTILKDTTIGEGTIIGAGCVVKGDIPPHSIVTANRELKIKPILSQEKQTEKD